MDINCKVGDYLIDFVCIYQITSITRNDDGDRVIHYQPIKNNGKVFCDSIPEKNLIKSGLRKFLSEEEIKRVLNKTKTALVNYEFDIKQVKEDIYQNIPINLVDHLKYLYEKDENLTKADLELREEMIDRLCREIAFVTKDDEKSIKKKIEKGLKNALYKYDGN